MGMMFGPGNAGKTTLVKALRLGLCTAPAFSPEELTHFRNVAIANIIESTTILLGQANIMDPIVHMDPMYIELKESLNKETLDLKEIIEDNWEIITQRQAYIIETFWKSKFCANLWKRKREFNVHMNDNTSHFLPRASMICDRTKMLSNADILMVREETKLLSQYELKTSSSFLGTISILDQGGQENHQEEYERKDSKLFQKYVDGSDFLFVVIPIGDLLEEEKSGSIVKGLRLLNSLLETSSKVNKPSLSLCPSEVLYATFKTTGIVVILNKVDKLTVVTDGDLSDWLRVAKSRKDCDPWLKGVLESHENEKELKGGAATFFFNVVESVQKLHSEYTGQLVVLSDSLTNYNDKLVTELTEAIGKTVEGELGVLGVTEETTQNPVARVEMSRN
jgi:GTPase SAR1 family protein